jgi:hypothetical protein
MFHLAGVLLSILGDKQAYLDPGSGSFLLQLLIAGLLGLAIFVRLQWRRIKKLFGFAPKEQEEDEVVTSVESEASVEPSPLKPHVTLPTKCPSCGAAVRSKEVKWLDEITVECNYCSMPIRGILE